jgi:hypothetical protein
MESNENPSSLMLDNPQNWLCATSLLDLEDPKLRIRVLRITQLATSATDKAIRVHDYIKSLPFGCVPASENLRSGLVLRAGFGDCHTKGTLFVSMLRLVGIPARLRFVNLSSTFLEGIISLPGIQIIHAITEAYLVGKWIQVDTYVTDETFEGHALGRLKSKGSTLGFGIHAGGQRYWTGILPAHGQYTPLDPQSLPTRDLGVAHDPEHFYQRSGAAQLKKGWLSRLKWMIAAKVINHRVRTIRASAF